jgi:heme/copper-type cytochrome/quinol oxidase subunit 1
MVPPSAVVLGLLLSAIPIGRDHAVDFQMRDTYYVIAHAHILAMVSAWVLTVGVLMWWRGTFSRWILVAWASLLGLFLLTAAMERTLGDLGSSAQNTHRVLMVGDSTPAWLYSAMLLGSCVSAAAAWVASAYGTLTRYGSTNVERRPTSGCS